MRITCLITVCAYLSSTVSTDEIQHLNKLRRIRLQEESIFDNATARQKLIPNKNRPDVSSMLRKFRSQKQVDTFEKPFQKRTYETQPSPQRHSRDRSIRPKHLKVRSIARSTYETNDNEVHEIVHKSIPKMHNEMPIYIKPIVRVTSQKTIFDSIVNVLKQLLNPPKKELGPIVGPIRMSGNKRKIYLRLLEPVESSHVNVRFVSEIPVPVVNEGSILSRGHESVVPFLPFSDPDEFLQRHPSSDVTFSSSTRHHSVQLPRNASHTSGKGRRLLKPKPATKPKRPSKETEAENVPPIKVEVTSVTESDKNMYYEYESEDDVVKQVTQIIKDAAENEQSPTDSLESYQLSTHHLPLRQIAPTYPVPSMEHTDSDSHENTYKMPSDSFPVAVSHSSSYEQYSDIGAEASGFHDQSSYPIPSTYATTYETQDEFSNAPSSYPVSYQNQNEFNNAPSSTSYVKQSDLFYAPTTHMTAYEEPANVPPTSSSYATPHEAQYGIKTGSSSQDALRVIDPSLYTLDPWKALGENHTNRVLEHVAIQKPYNSPNVNEIGSLTPLLRNTAQNGEQVTGGKVKREKSESDFQKNELNIQKSKSNFQKSVEITADDAGEKWQPLVFVPDANLHKTFADLTRVTNDNHYEITTVATVLRQQSVTRPRPVLRNTTPESTTELGRIRQRQNSRRHSVASTQNSKCSTSDKGHRCERTEPTIVSTPRPESIKIVKEQTRSIANIEPIATTSKSVTSSSVETSRSNVTTKNSWIKEPQALVMTTETLATSSTTEKLPLLIKVIKNTAEKLTEKKTTSRSMMSNITEKSIARTTERSSKAAVPRNNPTKRLQLPRLPMLMKKPTFVLKEMESSSTTKKTAANSTTKRTVENSTTKRTMANSTRKPIISTTEKMRMTKRSNFQGAVSKTKSSTT